MSSTRQTPEPEPELTPEAVLTMMAEECHVNCETRTLAAAATVVIR